MDLILSVPQGGRLHGSSKKPENTKEKFEDFKDKAKEKIDDLKEKIDDRIEDMKDRKELREHISVHDHLGGS